MLVPVPERWQERLQGFDPARAVVPKDAATIAVDQVAIAVKDVLDPIAFPVVLP